MATELNRQTLSKNQIDLILQHLNFKPEFNDYMTKKYANYYVDRETSVDPIKFYSTTATTVRVPYRFGVNLVKEHINHRIAYSDVAMKFTGQLYENQVKACGEAMKYLIQEATCILNLPTGKGKSICGAALACALHKLTCVLHPNETLNQSWKKTFQDHTDAKIWVIGEEIPQKVDVIICMDTRVHKIPKELLDQIGFLIIDEAHKFCTRTRAEAILQIRPMFTLAETATARREDGQFKMIEAICGFNLVTQVDDKKYDVTSIKTGFTPEIKQTAKGADWNHIVNQSTKNPKRNQDIFTLCQYFTKIERRKIIILTKRISHAKELSQTLREKLQITSDYLAGKKGTYKNCQVLVGTFDKMGVGFDEKNSCPDFDGQLSDVVILAISIKSIITFIQAIGRSRSQKPTIIHLVDDNPTVKRHFSNAKKIYRENMTCVNFRELNLDEIRVKVKEKGTLDLSTQIEKNNSVLEKPKPGLPPLITNI